MALIRNKDDKRFSKRSTDIDVPAVSRSSIITTGLALTSAADISDDNPETLYFHIFNQLPSQMTLFVWGELFNQNFYTELGQHTHAPGTLATGNVTGGTTSHAHTGNVGIGSHGHNASSGATDPAHSHRIQMELNPFQANDSGIDTINWSVANVGYDRFVNAPGSPNPTWIESQSISHSHSVTVGTTNLGSPGFTTAPTVVDTHSHNVTTGVSATTGIIPSVNSVRTSGSPKTYINGMLIEINGVDQTAALLAQVALAAFGDGTSGHAIVTTGVQLDLSPFIGVPGQHKVQFIQNGVNNGGKVRYNLYLL